MNAYTESKRPRHREGPSATATNKNEQFLKRYCGKNNGSIKEIQVPQIIKGAAI